MVDWLNCLPLEYKLKRKDMKVQIKQFGNTREADAGERSFWYETSIGNRSESSESLNDDLYNKWVEDSGASRDWDKTNSIFIFKTAITLG